MAMERMSGASSGTLSSPYKAYTESQLKEVFIRHDKNGDKCLSKEELRDAFDELGVFLPGRRAAMALKFADSNGDGVISENEINLLVRFAKRFRYRK